MASIGRPLSDHIDMAEKSAIETAMETAADGPRSVTNDGVTVTQRSVREQIEADRYLKSQEAKRQAKLGIRVQYHRPGPAT